MRAMIGSSTEIAIFEWDLQFWEKYYEKYKNKKINIKIITDDIFNSPKFKALEIQLEKGRIITKINERLKTENLNQVKKIGEIFSCILEEYARVSGKTRWGLKTPHNEFYFQEILMSHPDAKFIHMIRDPRDVATSFCNYANGKPLDFYIPSVHIKKWKNSYLISKMYSELYPHSYLTVKYEDLVQDSENILKNVCRIIDITYDNNILSMEGHRGWKGHNSSFDIEYPIKASNTIFTSGIGRYKTKLNKRLIRLYERKLASELLSLGYEVSPKINNFTILDLFNLIEDIYLKSFGFFLYKFYQNSVLIKYEIGSWLKRAKGKIANL